MNTNMTGLDVFQKSLRPCALDHHYNSIDTKSSSDFPLSYIYLEYSILTHSLLELNHAQTIKIEFQELVVGYI